MKVVSLSIRRARRRDVAKIAALYLEVAEEVAAREPSLRQIPGRDAVERRYTSRVTADDRTVLVALADGSIVGFVDVALQRLEDAGAYHRPGVDGYIKELIVTSTRRRKGVATALMRAAEDWIRDRQGRAVFSTPTSQTQRRALSTAIRATERSESSSSRSSELADV